MDKSSEIFQTADLMKVFGIGRNTLRLYEEMGLLSGMSRTEAGYRIYSIEHKEILEFIIKAKESGFTLNEIKALLAMKSETRTCGTISQEITEKVSGLKEEIKTLNNKMNFLNHFLQTCTGQDKTEKCDVVAAGFTEKACC